jgi:hypothetical protein
MIQAGTCRPRIPEGELRIGKIDPPDGLQFVRGGGRFEESPGTGHVVSVESGKAVEQISNPRS